MAIHFLNVEALEECDPQVFHRNAEPQEKQTIVAEVCGSLEQMGRGKLSSWVDSLNARLLMTSIWKTYTGRD